MAPKSWKTVTKKRSYGKGSLYQRESDGRWVVSRRVSHYFPTKAEAQVWMRTDTLTTLYVAEERAQLLRNILSAAHAALREGVPVFFVRNALSSALISDNDMVKYPALGRRQMARLEAVLTDMVKTKRRKR